MLVRIAAAIAFFVVTCLAAPCVRAGSSSGLMDISADGLLLACSNRDSGTVSIVDLKTNKKLSETAVGHKPECVSFIGSTHRLAVAVYHDDKVVFVDGDNGKATGEVAVLDEPYGVVSDSAGKNIYVTLSYPGKVIEIDAESRKIVRTLDAGAFARGIAIGRDDRRLFVTQYYNANVLALDVASGNIVDRWQGIASDNLARQILLHPTRPKAYLPHIRSAVERAHGEGSIFPYVSILDTDPLPPGGGEGRAPAKRWKRIPMDSFINVRVTANPWECTISPNGKRFFVVFSGTNDLYACDVLDDDYREVKYRGTLQLGNNPRAVRISPDNSIFYIYNALDFNIVAYDVQSLKKLATIAVTENPLGEEILLGKKLFYTALQPMASRRWIACSSCHPDGETDGRTWQNPEGLRDTPALAGLAWTHPLHWSADRDEVQDFEHTIRGQLMQGAGLVKGKMNPQMGAPNKGLSRELDALAAYTNTHKFPMSPHAKNGLSESAQRGRELFFSNETKCATCHSGPYYTDSTPANKLLVHDIGTGKPSGLDPSEKMPDAYDTPTLLGVYKTAPYLHHGKAATLEEVLIKFNREDRHGKTSQLKPAQIEDMVEFLKALPYEDPEIKAKELGLTKVER